MPFNRVGIYAILSSALFFIILISSCRTIKLECPDKSPANQTPFPSPKSVSLDKNYEVTIRFTNWTNNETEKFVERNFNGSLIIKKRSRAGEFMWINERIYYTDISVDGGSRQRFCKAYNSSADEDFVNAYGLPPAIIREFGVSGSNFAALLDKLITYTGFNSAGFQEGGETAGIETVDWIACAYKNNSTTDHPNIQINVQFAGELTKQQPYNPAFKNPQVYGLHIQLFTVDKATNKTMLLDHFSYELVAHDQVNPVNQDVEITPPRGTYCEGLPPAKLPSQLPARFESTISYSVADGIHPEVSTVDCVKLAYDEASRLVVYSMDFSKLGSRDSPLYGNITGFFGVTKVIHDFNYGLEYTLDERSVCKEVKPIHADLGDVDQDGNGTLRMRSSNVLLFLDAVYYQAGKVLIDEDLKLDSFVWKTSNYEDVASPWSNETVVELLYLSAGMDEPGRPQQLRSIVLYHRSKNGIHSKRVTLQLAELRNNTNSYNELETISILPCLPNPKKMESSEEDGAVVEKNEGDLFIRLDGVTLDKIKEVGMGRVRSAMAEAIATASNVSVLRITHFELRELNHELFAYFTIGQPSGIKPAKVEGLKKEVSVEEAQRALNATIQQAKGGLVVYVTGDDPRDRLTVHADKLGEQPGHAWPPPAPTPEFVGYTLSAMLVLAFFSFIFGVSLVIGAYFFYEKRQSIRGMAYQVFE